MFLRAFKRGDCPALSISYFAHISQSLCKVRSSRSFLYSYPLEMASNPPGACCASGFKHEGNPAGEIKTVEGGK
jgi:hypothetical protein